MAENRRVKIDKEIIVKITGEVETDLTDKEIQEAFDGLHKRLEKMIQSDIGLNGKCAVKPVRRRKQRSASHGVWENPTKPFPHYDWKCSECGCEEYRQVDSHGRYRVMNYCPECGAKMKLPESEEE